MMCRLILHLLYVFARMEHQPCAGEGQMQQHVDLVEGQPVFHLAPVPVEQHLTVMHIGIHHAAVLPAAVFFDEGNGRIKVADGNKRLDPIFMAFIEHGIVEGKALFARLGIIAVWQDAGPCDGQPETPEAHLGKEGDILFVVVIQVNGLVAGVIVPVVAFQHFQPAQRHRKAVSAKRGHIHGGKALAARLPCAFALVGSGGTAPQKIFRETAHT